MSSHKTITVSKNGPYIVSGSVPLRLETIGVNAAGESTEWDESDAFPASAQYALCRCGNSNKKPFCDGTHAKIAAAASPRTNLSVTERMQPTPSFAMD
ncbi:MAG: CDGSH iron-sulfur domain-containing protein [Candidatus Sulfotelmatobacter sp.]